MGLITVLSVWIDEAGMACAATIVTEEPNGRRHVRPRDVGPFDTPEEVFADLMAQVDIQQRLW